MAIVLALALGLAVGVLVGYVLRGATRPQALPLAETPPASIEPTAAQAHAPPAEPSRPLVVVDEAVSARATPPDDNDEVAQAAVRLLREAHATAQHLGFEHIPDSSQPSTYELTLPVRDPLERDAVAYLQGAAFACLKGITVRRDGVVRVRLDVAVPAPSRAVPCSTR